MARNLVLHIGTTKTGTTSIQHVLSHNRPALLSQGTCYPTAPGGAQHTLLAYAVMTNIAMRDRQETVLWQGMAPDDRIAHFRNEFDAEMKALPANINQVILSSEFIYIFLRSSGEVKALHDLLAPYFDNMRVVVYLRRQDAHFTSLYTQILRTGAVIPMESIVMRQHRVHEIDYAKLLNRWGEVFGTENIVPRLFENTETKRFDAVEDFTSLCGLTLPKETAEQRQESNQSMNLAGQKLLVDLGLVLQKQEGVDNVMSPVWRRLTDTITRAAPGKGWRPTREQARVFAESFNDSNEVVRSTWFPNRPSLFKMDFSEYTEEPVTVSPAALYETCLKTIMDMANREADRTFQQARDAVEAARAAGNRGRLKAALRRCVRIDSSDIPRRVMLAELLLEDGEFLAARGVINAALAVSPKDPAVLRLRERLQAGGEAPATPAAAPQRKNGALKRQSKAAGPSPMQPADPTA
jgi:hypothetical protein